MSKFEFVARQHSPGPWIFCGSHVDDFRGRPICHDSRTFASMNPSDMRLIACAPELLEACESVLRHHENKIPMSDQQIQQIRLLVLSALGERT